MSNEVFGIVMLYFAMWIFVSYGIAEILKYEGRELTRIGKVYYGILILPYLSINKISKFFGKWIYVQDEEVNTDE